MSMSRQDYELLAKSFRDSLEENQDLPHFNRSQARAGIRNVLLHLVDALGTANPNFDRAKFLRAVTGNDGLENDLRKLEGKEPLS